MIWLLISFAWVSVQYGALTLTVAWTLTGFCLALVMGGNWLVACMEGKEWPSPEEWKDPRLAETAGYAQWIALGGVWAHWWYGGLSLLEAALLTVFLFALGTVFKQYLRTPETRKET